MRLIRFLKAELADDAQGWVHDGLITAEQADAVLARYGARLGDGRRGRTAYVTLLLLGAVLVGLGAILLISTNWHEIPRSARLVGLLALTGSSNAAGVLRARAGDPGPAVGWLLLGSMLYGTTIFAVGQMYHLGVDFPEGILLWAVGVLPVGWFARSRALMVLASTISAVWFGVAVEVGQVPWAGLVLALLPVFFALRVAPSTLLFLGGIAGFVTAADLCLAQALVEVGVDPSLLPLMLPVVAVHLLYLLSRRLELAADPTLRDYAAALHLWSVRFGILVLLPLNFTEVWRDLGREFTAVSPGAVVALLLVTAAATAYATRERLAHAPGRRGWVEAAPGVAFAAAILVGTWGLTFAGAGDGLVVLPVAVTLGLLASGGWMIVRGIETASTTSFYLGTGTILVTALLRYADLVGDYIGTALVFMACGAAMAGAATLWKRRVADLRLGGAS